MKTTLQTIAEGVLEELLVFDRNLRLKHRMLYGNPCINVMRFSAVILILEYKNDRVVAGYSIPNRAGWWSSPIDDPQLFDAWMNDTIDYVGPRLAYLEAQRMKRMVAKLRKERWECGVDK